MKTAEEILIEKCIINNIVFDKTETDIIISAMKSFYNQGICISHLLIGKHEDFYNKYDSIKISKEKVLKLLQK